MPCRKVSSPPPLLPIAKPFASWNAMPGAAKPASPGAADYYVCDGPGEHPALVPKQLVASAAPWQKPAMFFSPVAGAPQLPPPPDSPAARLLYDITTQLEDFTLRSNLKLPMQGIGPGKVQTFTTAVLKDGGALVQLGIEFRPYAGPQSLLKPLEQVPILGPFFMVRVLSVEMEPASRKLQARVKYLWFPVTKQVHEDYLKKAELPPGLVKGPGFDLNQGIPVYSWQILDLVLKVLAAKGAQVAKNVGVDQVKPLLEESEILVEGDFSNRRIQLRGATLEFGPLAPGEKHRLVITGSLLDPVVKVHGLKSVQWRGAGGSLSLSNADERLEPLELRVHVDTLGGQGTRFEVPAYRSRKVRLELSPGGGGEGLRLGMEEGLELKGLNFSLTPEGPAVDIASLEAKQVSLLGQGLDLRTTPGDKASLTSLRLRFVGGRPEFQARLKGKATGELRVSRQGAELGFLKFEALEGDGSLGLSHEADGRARLEIAGRLFTKIPELRFLVQSEKLKASVQTKVERAEVGGVGRLSLWPGSGRALLEGLGEKPIRVRGLDGLVTFHQDPSKVAEWGELKKELGEALAQQVVTDFYIRPSEIEFQVARMDLAGSIPPNGSPALEIAQAELGPIKIRGDVWGKLFARLPGGIYFPVKIDEAAKMKDARVEIASLRDQKQGQAGREIAFQEIRLAGEESQATFSKKDQKRCGFDRQHLHAALGLFQFSPESREWQVKNLDPHFHIYLKNHVGGGCLKID